MKKIKFTPEFKKEVFGTENVKENNIQAEGPLYITLLDGQTKEITQFTVFNPKTEEIICIYTDLINHKSMEEKYVN